MHPKDLDRMANGANPDQEQSDQGLYYLPRPACPKLKDPYSSSED